MGFWGREREARRLVEAEEEEVELPEAVAVAVARVELVVDEYRIGVAWAVLDEDLRGVDVAVAVAVVEGRGLGSEARVSFRFLHM